MFVLLCWVGLMDWLVWLSGDSWDSRPDASSTVTNTIRTNRTKAPAEAKAAKEAVAPLLLRGQLLFPNEHD